MQHCGTASAEISTPSARAASRKARAQGVGGSDDQCGNIRLDRPGIDRLEAEHRRQHRGKAALAKRARSRLIVGMRAGDENGHVRLRWRLQPKCCAVTYETERIAQGL